MKRRDFLKSTALIPFIGTTALASTIAQDNKKSEYSDLIYCFTISKHIVDRTSLRYYDLIKDINGERLFSRNSIEVQNQELFPLFTNIDWKYILYSSGIMVPHDFIIKAFYFKYIMSPVNPIDYYNLYFIASSSYHMQYVESMNKNLKSIGIYYGGYYNIRNDIVNRLFDM